MLSWDPANLRSGPLLIHLSDVDDDEITQQVVALLRSKKIPLLRFQGGYSCQYEPHRLVYELKKKSIILTRIRSLSRRSYWVLSKPPDFGFGLGVSPKSSTHYGGFILSNINRSVNY
ncbi:unnamed protein product [Adineta steineri]|uniref:Uncharacterized protein n=1 Tax=Adineta steineri TaxID=433720 RepID=A0A819UWV7_9BILA|nr:unnamed protein product [Adineta steineri]